MFHLQVNDPAPDFAVANEKGDIIRLSDYRDSRLVLYFYPHDLTATCTIQACNLRDGYADLQANGYEVLGVSDDEAPKHQRFIARNALPFSLLCDTNHTLATAYGVWGEKKFMGKVFDGMHRTTFIINEAGIIVNIIKKVKSKVHTLQIIGEEL